MTRDPNVCNAQEAAHLLGAHVETIRRLARRGEIPAYKIGKDWRFHRDALQRWADEHQLRRNGPSVLAVDDDDGIRALLRRILETQGYRVHLASNGAEALEVASREFVDVILLDLMMPGMSGPEFLRRLRETDREAPVIIVTGYPDSTMMAEAMSYGPIMLLAKPILRDTLLRSVEIAAAGSFEARRTMGSGGALSRELPDGGSPL